MPRALIVVDLQRDFFPGGALGVPGGDEVLEPVDALLREGGFDFVAAISAVMGLMPRRGRDAVARVLKADKVLSQRDDAARRAYELRAARSEPGLEPGANGRELTETT